MSVRFAALAPELGCSDFAASLRFYRDLLGFAVLYERPGFAYLQLGEAQLMIEQENDHWTTGERVRPYGRGVNFQFNVADAAAMLARVRAAGWPLFRDLAETWRLCGDEMVGGREFLIQDPDGYLLRFADEIGRRPVSGRET